MECRQALEDAVERIAGELPAGRSEELARHLAACPSCRTGTEGLEGAWERLGELPEPEVTAAFRERTLGRMEGALLARRVVPFAPRPVWRELLKAAAVLAVGVGGWALGRQASLVRAGAPGVPPTVAVAAERQLDLATTRLDLGQRPRLANVAFAPQDPSGRLGISFDVTTRYTVVGRAEDGGVSALLAYLVQGGAGTEGARGRAIDLVAQHAEAGQPASPEIVSVLGATLRGDKNPGVRRKAAEALAQLPSSPATRDALVQALANDPSPAIRMIAVEGLAKAAATLRDPLSIETLRRKAGDEAESGTVRVKAATALGKLWL